jgi:hypothetical protein
MTRYEETRGGLRVTRQGTGWAVVHAATPRLAAVTGLRQRRFAEQARDDLLATGVDFTRDPGGISRDHAAWADVYYQWRKRTAQESFDDSTGEYYRASCHYGTFIPSARWAQAWRTAIGRNDGPGISLLLNKGNKAVDGDDVAFVRALLAERQPAFAAALEAVTADLAGAVS